MTYQKSLVTTLALLILLFSCASNDKPKRELIVPEGEPEWLYSPQSGCDKTAELCASGEGANFEASDLNAKKSLASIFETKIHSNFEFSKHTLSSSDVVDIKESVSNKINEQVDVILKGVYIKERFKKNGIKFSLSAINKIKGSNVLKDEINRVDDEISHFLIQRNRMFLKKMIVLYNLRSSLNAKFIILNDHGISSAVKLSTINSIKFSGNGGTKVQLVADSKIPRLLKKKFEQLMTEIGYKIISTDSVDYTLNISYSRKEEYLNVKGFKKYSFEINVESNDGKGKRLGGYIINLVAGGRTEKDAFAKVRTKIIQKFEKNIINLNLR
jgi:hypothetical protein